jgi:leucyl aminopeptidase
VVKTPTQNEDVLSCNNLPSSRTPRGHQFPMAFLSIASGLDDGPYRYTHMDIGGSAVEGCDWQWGRPTGRPVVALCAWAMGLGS